MEADETFSDHDSTFGGERDSIATSTTSIQSAVTRYTFEHGRRYHAYNAGSYNFPNDEQESDRMDVEHVNQTIQLGGRLHLAPLPEHPTEILDLGTGTGIWAIEMGMLQFTYNAGLLGQHVKALADEGALNACSGRVSFLSNIRNRSEVGGCEGLSRIQAADEKHSPIQPSWVPPNCKFEIDDFNEEWTWGEDRFDLIHGRILMGSVSSYPELYKQVYAALKPGGWFEISEIDTTLYSDDGTVTEDMAVSKWSKLWDEAIAKVGKRIPKAEEYYAKIADAGFSNLDMRIIKRPTNDWPKDPAMKQIGAWTHLNYMKGVEAFTMALFTRVHGWTPEEVQVLLAQIRLEWNKRKIHGWQKGIRIYAQKPVVPQRIP